MLNRRSFLTSTCAGLSAGPLLAAVQPTGSRSWQSYTTEYGGCHSHAWHMAERLSAVRLSVKGLAQASNRFGLSLYSRSEPANDLSRSRERNWIPDLSERGRALRCEGSKLAVDAVLVIGEHGNYPKTNWSDALPAFGVLQTEVDSVFRKTAACCLFSMTSTCHGNGSGPKWSTRREYGRVASGRSSLPCTWRMPSIDFAL